MLSYAGVTLHNLSPLLREKAEAWWDENAPDLWQYPGYQTSGLYHLPVPPEPTAEKARLNTLYWPTGASRWGVFHAVCGYAATAQITQIVGQSSPVAQTLLVRDERNNKQISTQMALLAVRPLFSGGDTNTHRLQWLTFVDARYFWWTRNLTYTFEDGDSWATLITNLVDSASGLTPSISAVSSNYGTPNYARWNNPGCPLPLLIDAACTTIGRRFVFKTDGTCVVQSATAAAVDDDTRWTDYKSHCVIGGRMAATDVAGNIPAAVTVGSWDKGAGTAATTISLASLSLAEYGSIQGVTNTRAWVMGDRYTGQASPTAVAYATQAATDYYRWALSLTEATFRSIQDLVPNGLDDRVEWEYAPPLPPENLGPLRENVPTIRSRRLLTRVVPTAFGDRNIYGSAPAGEGGEECCGEGADYYTKTHTRFAFNIGVLGPNRLSVPTTAVLPTFLKVPANSGDVWIQGSLLGRIFGPKPLLYTVNIRLFAAIGTVNADGTNPAPLNGYQVGVRGYWQNKIIPTTTPGGSEFLDIPGGDLTSQVTGNVSPNWSRTLHQRFRMPNWGTDRYFVWCVSAIVDYTNNGSQFQPPSYGVEFNIVDNQNLGRSHLSWIKVCCDEPELQPPSGNLPPPAMPAPSSPGSVSLEDYSNLSAPVVETSSVTTLENGKTYYADNAGGVTPFYLSPLAVAGERYKIVGRASGGWQVKQRAGQTVHAADDTAPAVTPYTTTTGTAGSVSGLQWGTAVIECVIDGTDFVVTEYNGLLTWV